MMRDCSEKARERLLGNASFEFSVCFSCNIESIFEFAAVNFI